MIARQVVRRFTTSAIRRSAHGPEGFPGANLPFPLGNRFKITAIFAIFFGSAYALPYIMLRHQMTK